MGVDTAVVTGEQASDYNALLQRVHEAMTTGSRPPARPREVIAESWRRVRGRGLRTDRNTTAGPGESARGVPSADIGGVFRSLLPHAEPQIDDGTLMLVVADAQGRIVDAAGSRALRARAERIGFLPERMWTERTAGTNAIGTALVTRQPVAVHGAEHFLSNQHGWSCAAAPVRDPWTGAVVGAVDLSARVEHAHPVFLTLASVLARTAGLELASRHRHDLERLRSRALPRVSGTRGPWLVVDEWGWVADTQDLATGARVALPADLDAGDGWIPPFGRVRIDPLGSGWLIRPQGSPASPEAPGETPVVEIHAGEGHSRLRFPGHGRRGTVEITPRQAEILALLARAEDGLSAAELSTRLYGTPEHDVTVRAEISRLRKRLGAIVVAAPYRLAAGVRARVVDEPGATGTPQE